MFTKQQPLLSPQPFGNNFQHCRLHGPPSGLALRQRGRLLPDRRRLRPRGLPRGQGGARTHDCQHRHQTLRFVSCQVGTAIMYWEGVMREDFALLCPLVSDLCINPCKFHHFSVLTAASNLILMWKEMAFKAKIYICCVTG